MLGSAAGLMVGIAAFKNHGIVARYARYCNRVALHGQDWFKDVLGGLTGGDVINVVAL